MIIPKSLKFYPDSEGFREQLATLPTSPGVYLILTPGGSAHISLSGNLRRRISRLLASSYTARESLLDRLREKSSAVECWPTGSKLESSLLTYQLGRQYFPRDYLVRLHLRLPWFVAMTDEPFPRIVTVNRFSAKARRLFGPFTDRESAAHYAEAVSNLFQLRRCPDVLQPHFEHPGCVYGEMNQCLRPCQCAVSSEEYRSETGRASDFLGTNGRSAIASLTAARDRAAEQTDFETAAALHKRIDKLAAAALERGEIASEAAHFSGVALTRGVAKGQYRLWPMLHGNWQTGLELDFTTDAAQTKSLDAHLRELLAGVFSAPRTTGNPIEEIALFSRWYHSSFREGDWFPFRSLPDLNYRKLVRAISNLVRTDNLQLA